MARGKHELSPYFEKIDGSNKQEKFLNFIRYADMWFYGGYIHKGKENILPFEQKCLDTFNRVNADDKLRQPYMDLFNILGQRSENFNDALGDFYQAEISHGDNEQFFTPIHICDLMAEMTITEQNAKEQQNILDSACGCGRTLLAGAKAMDKYGRAREVGFVGVDIDERCVLMTIFNLCINTLQGEVVLGNALTDEYQCAVQIHIADLWKRPEFKPEMAGYVPRYLSQWTVTQKPRTVKDFVGIDSREQPQKEVKPLITEKVIKQIKKKAPQVTEQEIKQAGQLSLF